MRLGHGFAALLSGAAVCGFLAVSASSAPREVVLKSGQPSVVGEVIEGEDIVQVTPASTGKPLKLKKSLVAQIRDLPPVGKLREEFDKRKGALKADDSAGHLGLAEWALDRGLRNNALAVYDDLAAKGNAFAKALAADLRSGSTPAATDKSKTPGKTDAKTATTDVPPTAPVGADGVAAKIEDPNLIKKIQLREYLTEETPKIGIDPKAKLEKPAKAELTKLIKDQAAALAHARKAADLSPFTVSPEPAVLKEWHVKNLAQPRPIHDIVVARCAGGACHGGTTAKFQLLNTDIRNPAVAYGNFEFIRRYRDGMMIQTDAPELGGLLIYGLPAALKDKTLPTPVQRHEAVWKSVEEKDFVALKNWIKKLRSGNQVLMEPEKPAGKDGKDGG